VSPRRDCGKPVNGGERGIFCDTPASLAVANCRADFPILRAADQTGKGDRYRTVGGGLIDAGAVLARRIVGWR
jgi:hypothetical protein